MKISTSAVRVKQRCGAEQRLGCSSVVSNGASLMSLRLGRTLAAERQGGITSFAPSPSIKVSSEARCLGRQQVYRSVNRSQHQEVWEFSPACGSVSRSPHHRHRPCRILCYGDSNTIGFNNKGRSYNPYGESLAEALTKGGARCEVGICGLNGHTAQEFAAELEEPFLQDASGNPGKGLSRIIEEDGPIDLVILMVGTNDLGRGVQSEDIANDVVALHTACHRMGVPSLALAPPFPREDDGRSCAKQLAQVKRLVLDLLPSYLEGQDGLLGYFDTEELVPRSHGNHWEPDEIHLSAAGSQLLGRRLAEWLLPILQAAQLEAGVPLSSDDAAPPTCRPSSPSAGRPRAARRARTASPQAAVTAPLLTTSGRRAQTSSPDTAPLTNRVSASTAVPQQASAAGTATSRAHRAQSASPLPTRSRTVAAQTWSHSGAVAKEVAVQPERTQSPPLASRSEFRSTAARNDPSVRPGTALNSLEPRLLEPERIIRANPQSSRLPPPAEQHRGDDDAQTPCFSVGCAVEIWSKSHQIWVPGSIKKVMDNKVSTAFKINGVAAKKVLDVKSPEIRLM